MAAAQNSPAVARGAGAAAFLLIGLALAGCEKPVAAPPEPPPPAVGVAQPVRREIVEWDEYTGRLIAVESVDVRARISGYLDSIHFTDGQLVKKGDLLFVIDPRPFKAAFDAADADAKTAETRAELTNIELSRAKKLIQTKTISAEEYDARVKAAETAAATVLSAKARAEQARLNVEFTEVRAPMSGRISRHLTSVGNLIAGGSADSTVLAGIVAVDPIHCYFDISEQDYLKYLRLQKAKHSGALDQNGLEVHFGLLDENDFPHRARMNYVDNQIDRATGALRGRAVIDNSKLGLVPGVFVKLRIPGSAKRTAVLVPDKAVIADQSDRFVLVVGEKNVVKQQRVVLGRRHDGLRIVTSGLTGAESVIVEGLQRAKVGTPVAPEKTEIKVAATTPLPAGKPDVMQGALR
ncbi:MAG TPA: efflux RND transporter periplasmic adaptor subunit [Planctomycetia bacterium]|nr:efflux RND transporter periplasmic adaptor subunit [Planctomycetia bacterium]